mmetsp:Transcript_121867/g.339795  ORF Transcript_121867/g.339795 Transcript_121867/m.339795 type:complete len:282 (-) Transcript_121867:184-1029(-)
MDLPRDSSMRTQASHVHSIIANQRTTVREPFLREKLLAEFVGTFFLVLTVGVSVAGGGSLAAVAIGLVLSVQIYTFGAVSGGFFNPAVTLAVLLSGRKKITTISAALYIVAQLLGGILAGFCAFAATGKTFAFDYGLTRGLGTSLELEVLFTMALCGTVLAAGTSNDAPNHYFGFAIGLTVTGGALASGGFDQGSFNPAVTLGTNLANYANSDQAAHTRFPSAAAWAVFLLAPIVGAALAAAVFRGTRGNEFSAIGPGPAPELAPASEKLPGANDECLSSV